MLPTPHRLTSFKPTKNTQLSLPVLSLVISCLVVTIERMSWNHILLVEDDDSLRLTQAMYLEREGFQVTAVGSGAEAISRIAADQYQAVVTDLRLDEIDGLEILAAVKRAVSRDGSDPHHRLRVS